MDSGQDASKSSEDGDRKVRIRLKTDPPKDPRSIKAPKNKSAMKKDYVPEHKEPEVSQEESNQRRLSEDSKGHNIVSGNFTTEQEPQEIQPPDSNEKNNEIDRKSPQPTESDNKENDNKDNDKERAEGNELSLSSDKMKVIGDSTREKQNSLDDIISTISSRTNRANSLTQQSARSFSAESEMDKTDGRNSVNPSISPTISTPILEQTENEFQNTNLPRGIEEQADTLPDLGLNKIKSNENETLVGKEDPSVDRRSSKTEVGSKTNMGNGELMTENVDANKEMKKSSTGSITGSIRQSIEKFITQDGQSKKGSTERNENTNHDRKQESSFNSDNLSVEDAKKSSLARNQNGDPNKTGDRGERNSNGESVTVDRVSVHSQESPTKTPSTKLSINVRRKTNEKENGMDENDQSKGIIEEDGNTDKKSSETITATTNDSIINGITYEEDIPVLLKRTTGSEDLKITELKDRVRPGQVFIVRGETDSFTVKWAEKRKVLAYKVGSKTTSRFSSVLIKTAEQLERASERRPSILSEFTHPTEGAPKGSILSTYLAGANTRRGIRDHLNRDALTNRDHQTECTAEENHPDKTFCMTDHISPDKEAFGGAEQVQTTTGDATYQTNNYNYPFLTDYDVNHKREAKK